jgi:hypothetical protein
MNGLIISIGDVTIHKNTGEWFVILEQESDTIYKVYRHPNGINSRSKIVGTMDTILSLDKEDREQIKEWINKLI